MNAHDFPNGRLNQSLFQTEKCMFPTLLIIHALPHNTAPFNLASCFNLVELSIDEFKSGLAPWITRQAGYVDKCNHWTLQILDQIRTNFVAGSDEPMSIIKSENLFLKQHFIYVTALPMQLNEKLILVKFVQIPGVNSSNLHDTSITHCPV